MAIDLKYSSNPFQQKTGEEKIEEMKKNQEAKRAEAAEKVDEYRSIFKAAEKDFEVSQSIFLQKQREFAKHDKQENDYKTLKEDFLTSKKQYQKDRSYKDLRLDLLQFRSEEYTKASRINILDLV